MSSSSESLVDSGSGGSEGSTGSYSSHDNRRILATCGYYLGSKLNCGTFATVRYAEKRSGRNVKKMAVKIINKSKASALFVDKFLPRELALWPELQHNHIVQVHQVIYIYDRIYAFMELAPNGSVIEYLQKYGAVNENVAKRWARGLCLALRYCHRRGIAHRDVKCDNLLLDRYFEIKLGDFGFCKKTHTSDNDTKLFSETYCGSAAYVAPEILQGRPYDPLPADVWSAGICIYVVMNNAMPFDDSNIKRMLRDQLQGNWRYSSKLEVMPSTPAKKVIASMMEPNVHRRATTDFVLNSVWLKKASRT